MPYQIIVSKILQYMNFSRKCKDRNLEIIRMTVKEKNYKK